MSPIMQPDADWIGSVQASTPVFPKGDYELTVKSVRGQAWPKKDKADNPTGEVTMKVAIRPQMVGRIDSKGKLVTTDEDGKNLKGVTAEDVNCWMHSEGGQKMAKGQVMAIAGYNPRDPADEEKFNAFVKDSKLDLSVKCEENETGDGYDLILGGGWEVLLVGKNFRAHMEPETREVEGRDPITSQNYKSLSPVNG